MLPKNALNSAASDADSTASEGYLLPKPEQKGNRAFLDGNFMRRAVPVRRSEYCIWDSALPGFGLRVRPSGRCTWFVRVRHRNKHRRITLGGNEDVDAEAARLKARRLLANIALDGLPTPVVIKGAPLVRDFVGEHWPDLSRVWKPSTTRRNLDVWTHDLAPVFGRMRIGDVASADIARWRDDCAGVREARLNRAIPVLSALFKYAEALSLRRKGSNPCRGMPRYKRPACERYLSPAEYRRIGAALRGASVEHPAETAIIRLLLFTGARVGEIRDLRWEWVRPPHLALPDSKTGPKTIWLNRQARAVLAALPRRDGGVYVFPNKAGTRPLNLDNWWSVFRRTCALPDVRIHDLRHSFASTAIMDHVSLATIGKLLGHRLPETTAKYAHLSDDVIADAATRISGRLAQAMGLRP